MKTMQYKDWHAFKADSLTDENMMVTQWQSTQPGPSDWVGAQTEWPNVKRINGINSEYMSQTDHVRLTAAALRKLSLKTGIT